MHNLQDALATAPAVMAIPPLTGEYAFVYFGHDDVIDVAVARKLGDGNCRAYAVSDTWAAVIWCVPDVPMWHAFGMRNGAPAGQFQSPSISKLIDILHAEYGD